MLPGFAGGGGGSPDLEWEAGSQWILKSYQLDHFKGKLFHRCIHDISPDDRGRASSGSGIHGLMHLLK